MDEILAEIDSESLTDLEFDSLDIDEEEYSQEVFDALKGVRIKRCRQFSTTEKLAAYFSSAGAQTGNDQRLLSPISLWEQNLNGSQSQYDSRPSFHKAGQGSL